SLHAGTPRPGRERLLSRKRIAVLRVAEPLRRAALAGLELRIAPQAGWLDRSGGDQPRIPVHQYAPQTSPAREWRHCTRLSPSGQRLPPLHRDDLTQVTRVTISPVSVRSVRGTPRSIRSADGSERT